MYKLIGFVRVLWTILVLCAAALFVLIWLDPEWLPQELRNIDWWRTLIIPALAELGRRIWIAWRRLDKWYGKMEKLARGENTGNTLVQMHSVKPCRIKGASRPELKLGWLGVEAYSEDEAPWLYGSREGAELFQRAAKRATRNAATPVPLLEGLALQNAFRWAVNELSSKFAQLAGEKHPWVIVTACEDEAPIVCIRFFLVPASMLALFLDTSFCRRLHVELPHHWYRVVTLHTIARQVFAGSSNGRLGNYYYAVRDLRLKTDDNINWWRREWDIDPRTSTEEEVTAAQQALLRELDTILSAGEAESGARKPAVAAYGQEGFVERLLAAGKSDLRGAAAC